MKLEQLAELGQSVWYDYIQRALLESAPFRKLIADGLRGITSNPSIFHKAITGSDDYDEALKKLKGQKDVNAAYETLILEDIGRAADLFLPVYDATEGLDGYVSIEVNPLLAYDSEQTVAEALRLFNTLARPNIMIKVPATEQGLPAVTELLGFGVNVNVTLIFGLEQYKMVADAFQSGLERLARSKGDLSKVASVASFFVSRVDTVVDKQLEAAGNTALRGKIAVANSKVAYAASKEIYSQPRWQKLAAEGARKQRLLWASTGTKNAAYSDTLYVDELIGPATVNTMPPATLNAFLDHGVVAPTLEQHIDQAYEDLQQLEDLGIDLKAVTDELLQNGVAQFEAAFKELMTALEQKLV